MCYVNCYVLASIVQSDVKLPGVHVHMDLLTIVVLRKQIACVCFQTMHVAPLNKPHIVCSMQRRACMFWCDDIGLLGLMRRYQQVLVLMP